VKGKSKKNKKKKKTERELSRDKFQNQFPTKPNL
jgi:hypothetical protein